MSYQYIENQIEIWGRDRGIIQNGTAYGQATKTIEETTELLEAIEWNDREEIIDAIGDIGVTLIMQCAIQNVSFVECLEAAYKQIKDRKGYLNANGVFVKEEK